MEQVGVVAVTEDGADRRVSEGGHEVARPVLRCAVAARRGVLDRLDPDDLAQAAHRLLVALGEMGGAGQEGSKASVRQTEKIIFGASGVFFAPGIGTNISAAETRASTSKKL